jgi:phosphatidylserine/phosphatidylglycerophosphate/cardiolipin synthase-like enzyme
MGSANYTPEGLTSQANLMHIIDSPQLAKLYAERQKLMQGDPTKGVTSKGAAWSKPVKVGKASIRVFFSPEPKPQRESIDAVVNAVKAAKSSVIFCMFSPTDPALLKALLSSGDKGNLLYGLLNAISDPNNKKEDLSDSGEAPVEPSAAAQIKVAVYNRSRKDKKVLPYSYFAKETAPAGWLPELTAVDMSSKATLGKVTATAKKKRPPPAVHIHHKFIVIDADTSSPIIYTGSANLSNNSTHENDENLLEIKGSPELAQTYFAEFMRLYEHYRARALWARSHPKGAAKKTTAGKKSKADQTFTLKKSRDEWVKGAYKKGTPEYLARTALAKP